MGFVRVVGQELVRSAPEKNATARKKSARLHPMAVAMAPPKLNPVAKTWLLSMQRSPSTCARIASVNVTSVLLQVPAPSEALGATKMVFLLSWVKKVK